MKRATLTALGALASLLLLAGSAQAAVPTVGSLAATNIQGVSALLKGTVDPEGLPTTYHFEYVDQPSFAGATATGAVDSVRFRLRNPWPPAPPSTACARAPPTTTAWWRPTPRAATSAEGTFTTTEGFGFLPGRRRVLGAGRSADGGGVDTRRAHTPTASTSVSASGEGGEFEDQPGVTFPDGDIRDLDVDLPPGLILNPKCDQRMHAGRIRHSPLVPLRIQPLRRELPGQHPGRHRRGADQPRRRRNAPLRRSSISTPPPGVAAQIGFAPYGSPIILDVAIHAGRRTAPTRWTSGRATCRRRSTSTPRLSLWGTPWDASHNGRTRRTA